MSIINAMLKKGGECLDVFCVASMMQNFLFDLLYLFYVRNKSVYGELVCVFMVVFWTKSNAAYTCECREAKSSMN